MGGRMTHESVPHRPSTCPDCQKSQQRPYTVADVVMKWSPLTRPKNSASTWLEGREEEFTAWVMEEEARFLKDPANSEHIGMGLKYVFPLLRRVAPSYANGEMPEFTALIDHLKNEAALITDALISKGIETGKPQEIPSPEEINKMLPPVAERLQNSIKTFAKAPR